MNSHWNENLINFTIELVSTRFDGQIKIRVSRALVGVNFESNLVKVTKNL